MCRVDHVVAQRWGEGQQGAQDQQSDMGSDYRQVEYKASVNMIQVAFVQFCAFSFLWSSPILFSSVLHVSSAS